MSENQLASLFKHDSSHGAKHRLFLGDFGLFCSERKTDPRGQSETNVHGARNKNLDRVLENSPYVPTFFQNFQVSVSKKININIMRHIGEPKAGPKSGRKPVFQLSLWTLNLKNFPNRGAKGRRRGSAIFQIETALWGSPGQNTHQRHTPTLKPTC